MSGAPYLSSQINAYNASVNPSTVHIHNTWLARYFKRYLLQKAISVFKWNLPEEWSEDYFLYCLYGFGHVAIIETDKFGVIPQECGLYGRDVFYRPTHATIANPLLKGIIRPRIGTECSLIRLQPDYCGIMDLVDYYGDMLALCAESVSINLVNSHMAYVMGVQDKQQAETVKKLFDKVAAGETAVIADRNLFKDDGSPAWNFVVQNIGQNYIAPAILSDMRKIEAMYDTDVGIPNANTDKRERLISDEVNANNVETSTRCELWLETIRKGLKQANDMFGLNLSVNWRVAPGEEVEPNEQRDEDIDSGSLSVR